LWRIFQASTKNEIGRPTTTEQQIADFRAEDIDAVPDNIIPGQRGTYRRQRLMMQMQLENESTTQAQFDESL
jgi:hypothetical protein